MLKVIVNAVNVVTACYVVYLIGGTIYEMGKESGRKEVVSEAIPIGATDENGNPVYKVIDGVLYVRVDKK